MDVNSELIEAQAEIKDTDSAHNANRKGLFWFNRAANKLKMIYNSTVEILATESHVDAEIAASEQALSDNGLTTSEQASTPSTPSTDLRRIYAKSDGIYELGSDGVEYKLFRETDDHIRDIIVEEFSINVGSGGSATYPTVTVPTGYRWVFTGSGYGYQSAFGGNVSVTITFDGKGFGGTTTRPIYGSGDDTESTDVSFTQRTTGGFSGVFIFYKKQNP